MLTYAECFGNYTSAPRTPCSGPLQEGVFLEEKEEEKEEAAGRQRGKKGEKGAL
jgi:hypothetical protein